MKQLALFLTFVTASCMAAPVTVPAAESATEALTLSPVPTEAPREIRIPPMDASWHVQYAGEVDPNLDVDVYNLDLFDTDPAFISQLHQRGVYVMCYFSAGSFEDWRPDADQFPSEILGNDMEGWPGEKWLDIRQINVLAPLMEARLDLAISKNCDGVDPDNTSGYAQNTGFPLTYQDQLQFDIWLANSAHARGLAIGLKNDIEQIPDLLPYFDWELNEQCFYYEECDLLLPFIKAHKPVFNIEYELSPEEFCPQAKELGFNSVLKNLDLDAQSEACK